MSSSSTSKIQPLDKTVVTEFKIQVADIHLRTKYLNGSIAVKVPRDGAFTTSDANVTDIKHVLLNDIKSIVAIHSFEPFEIDISNATGMLTGLKCSGLFLFYGALDSVTIRAVGPNSTVRLAYLYA